jgi:hypothetical protein
MSNRYLALALVSRNPFSNSIATAVGSRWRFPTRHENRPEGTVQLEISA